MANLKRLAVKTDGVAIVSSPVTSGELTSRQNDYPLLTPEAFSKKYRDVLFRYVQLTYTGENFEIQMNHCTNPYCRWFGMPQERFETAKKKPYRYKLAGTDEHDSKKIVCNPDPARPYSIREGHSAKPLSNWSIGEEISRLATNDRVTDVQPEYVFHREDCPNENLTPFENKQEFYRRGKSTGNSQKWQCKACHKFTNVLPKQRQSFRFNQKRNDIIPMFARCLLGRVPVKRTCEILEIGSKTYYSKLE